MEAIWEWGLKFIRIVQQVHGPVLDTLFKTITFTGEELFFLILIPLVYWCLDSSVGARLGIIFLLSTYANTGFKDIFAHPRPFELDPVVRLYRAEGYGFPSGHSQSAVIVWGIIADGFRRTWLWVVAILLMVLVGFSRIYLGVHFPTDVLGGWAIGAFFLAAYLMMGQRVVTLLQQMGLAIQLTLAFVMPTMLLALHPNNDNIGPMAVLMGISTGLALTIHLAPFSTAGPLRQRVLRFAVGVIVLFALYYGLKLIFPGMSKPLYFFMRFVRYTAVGLWVSLGAPWLFRQLRLTTIS
jgi:membrane-associated phospholipid phosphatase